MGVSAFQDVDEADAAVEERMDSQLSAFADPVALARMPQMLDHRIVADAEDSGDLPVRLAARRPADAVPLPVGEPGQLGEPHVPHPRQPAPGLEGEGADELRKRETILADGRAGFGRE